jgi:superfamily II DNA or RNA helicase
MVNLRPYQIRLVNDLYRALNSGLRRVALIAGTGAGKSVVAAKIINDAISANKRILFVVHLDVLVGQTFDKVEHSGFPVGFIKSGWEENKNAPLQIASIQTMQRRDWWKDWPADIIIFDEAHLTVLSQIGKELIYETHPKAVIIGMTATPKRLSKEQLGDHLEGFVCSPTPSELQDIGFLSPLRYFVPANQPDLSNVEIVGEDYEPNQLKNACDKPELIARIVEDWVKYAYNLRTIAFCVDVEHAQKVAYAFWKRGIKSACVTGETSIKERERIYKALDKGEYKVLTSVNVISIGFDVPSVECGLLLRPTESWALHIQQIGRVMRISPKTGKEYGIIIDQAGNIGRLGKPEDIKDYDLPTSIESKSGRVAPKKECPICGRTHNAFVVDCVCGFHWLEKYEVNTNGLVELPGRRFNISDAEARFRNYRREAFISNKLPILAEYRLAEDYGISPLPEWYRGAIFCGEQWLVDQYLQYLATAAHQLNQSDDWIVEQFELEFGMVAAQ